MSPWDLIVWALATAVSLLIVAVPLGIFVLLITMGRGKI